MSLHKTSRADTQGRQCPCGPMQESSGNVGFNRSSHMVTDLIPKLVPANNYGCSMYRQATLNNLDHLLAPLILCKPQNNSLVSSLCHPSRHAEGPDMTKAWVSIVCVCKHIPSMCLSCMPAYHPAHSAHS